MHCIRLLVIEQYVLTENRTEVQSKTLKPGRHDHDAYMTCVKDLGARHEFGDVAGAPMTPVAMYLYLYCVKPRSHLLEYVSSPCDETW